MKNKSLVIDMDGVLADFNTSFAKLLMKIEPQTKVDYLSSTFPTEWDWPRQYTRAAVDAAWTEVRNSGVFWRSLFPYASAYEDIKYLKSLDKQHHIYFCTTRPGKTAKAETEEWLRGHGFDGATVVIAQHKAAFSESVLADLIIDDKPENLKGHLSFTHRALMRRPYNADRWHDFDSAVPSVREALAFVL